MASLALTPRRPPAVHGRGRHVPTVARAVAQARTRVRPWLGSRPARARRGRSRNHASSRLQLLARLRRAARHDHLHASRFSRRTTRQYLRPRSSELEALAAAAPPMTGAEYIDAPRSSKRSGRRSRRRFDPSSPNRRRRSRTFSSVRARRGISSAASTSTSPRTARTTRRRSRFWRPTRRSSRRRPRRSICRSAAR